MTSRLPMPHTSLRPHSLQCRVFTSNLSNTSHLMFARDICWHCAALDCETQESPQKVHISMIGVRAKIDNTSRTDGIRQHSGQQPTQVGVCDCKDLVHCQTTGKRCSRLSRRSQIGAALLRYLRLTVDNFVGVRCLS